MERAIIDALVFASGTALLALGVAIMAAPLIFFVRWCRRRARHRRRRAHEHDHGVCGSHSGLTSAHGCRARDEKAAGPAGKTGTGGIKVQGPYPGRQGPAAS
jgi:hypothetical protein